MNCLRLRRFPKIFYLFEDKYKVSVFKRKYSIKPNYILESPSIKMKFLDYLTSKEVSSKAAHSANTFFSDNNFPEQNDNNLRDADRNIELVNIDDKDLWTKKLDKETIMVVLQESQQSVLRKSLSRIDSKCLNLIEGLKPSQIIKFLILLMKINESHITYLKFYKKAITLLKVAMKRDQLNAQEIIMLLFFASLQKKNGTYDVKHIKQCLPALNKLPLVDKCILADALFKCSIKFQKFEGRIMEEVIENNADFLVEEKHLLVPLCKVVRHIGPSKHFDIKNLSDALKKSSEKFEPLFIAHISSLYAEALIKDEEVLQKLFVGAFDCLSENKFIQAKYIEKTLWAAHTLNYQINKEDLDRIETYIIRKFSTFKDDNIKLLKISLSMWIHQHRSEELIQRCFNEKIFHSILQNPEDWKSRARLQLFVNCIKIEAPQIKVPAILDEPYNIGFKVNKHLRFLFKKLVQMRDDLKLSNIEIICPIRGIFIPSIGMNYDNKTAYIDILDEETCLTNSQEPHGLMKLKLRLISSLNCRSILILPEYVEDDEKFREHLLTQIV